MRGRDRLPAPRSARWRAAYGGRRHPAARVDVCRGGRGRWVWPCRGYGAHAAPGPRAGNPWRQPGAAAREIPADVGRRVRRAQCQMVQGWRRGPWSGFRRSGSRSNPRPARWLPPVPGVPGTEIPL